jgi:hypothetical protein
MNDFKLVKWYMDATDNTGKAFIAYSAHLRWKSINLHYNGFTYAPGEKAHILKRNSFSLKHLPVITENSVDWKCLHASGSWKRTDESFSEILLQEQAGEIQWSCVFPKATALIRVGDQSMKNCVGYVERIIISIPAWKLPIHQLHWGRYLSEMHSLVWIKWTGPVPKLLAFLNGTRYVDCHISTEMIIFDGYSLELLNKQTLRTGTILSTVFTKFPLLAKLFPRKIVQLQENKWLSNGLLKRDGKIISKGMAIHEHVLWQQ